MSYPNQDEVRRIVCNASGIGMEAEICMRVLNQIHPVLRSALLAFYTSSLPFERQAGELLDISEATYRARLSAAHVAVTLAHVMESRACATTGHPSPVGSSESPTLAAPKTAKNR